MKILRIVALLFLITSLGSCADGSGEATTGGGASADPNLTWGDGNWDDKNWSDGQNS